MRAASAGRVPGPTTQTVLVEDVPVLVVVTPGTQPIEPEPQASGTDSEMGCEIGIVGFESRRKKPNGIVMVEARVKVEDEAAAEETGRKKRKKAEGGPPARKRSKGASEMGFTFPITVVDFETPRPKRKRAVKARVKVEDEAAEEEEGGGKREDAEGGPPARKRSKGASESGFRIGIVDFETPPPKRKRVRKARVKVEGEESKETGRGKRRYAICMHGKQKCQCTECGGSSICVHKKRRSECTECGGSRICEHKKVRSRCTECGGSNICEHKKRRSRCTECGVRRSPLTIPGEDSRL